MVKGFKRGGQGFDPFLGVMPQYRSIFKFKDAVRVVFSARGFVAVAVSRVGLEWKVHDAGEAARRQYAVHFADDGLLAGVSGNGGQHTDEQNQIEAAVGLGQGELGLVPEVEVGMHLPSTLYHFHRGIDADQAMIAFPP